MRDAIEFALTGTARDPLALKNRAHLLVRRGAEDMEVALEWDGGRLRRTASGCSLAAADLATFFGDERLRKCTLNAFRFLDQSAEDRRKIVATVTGSAQAVEHAAEKAARDAGLGAEEAHQLAQLAATGLKRAEKYAVDRRVERKRQLATLEETAKTVPAAEHKIGDKVYDLRKVTADKVKAQLATRERELEAAQSAVTRAKLLPAQKALEAEKAKAEANIARLGDGKDGEKRRASLAERLAAAERTRTELVKLQGAAQAEKAAGTSLVARLEALGSKCPTCTQPIDKKLLTALAGEAVDRANKAATEIESLATQLEEVANEIKAIGGQITALEGAEADRQVAADTVARCDRDLAVVRQLAAEEAKVATLKGSIEVGRNLLEAATAFSAVGALDATRAALDKEIAAWDAAAHALGAGGPISELSATGFDLKVVQAGAAAMLGREIAVDPEWNIALGGLADWQLSRSTRYRLGLAFAAGLCRAAGSRLLVADEADVLDPRWKKAATGWLLSLVRGGQLDTVVLCATTPAKPEPASAMPPEIRRWWCQDGTVVAV